MLTHLQDDHWKHVRSSLTPAFSTGKLRRVCTVLRDVIAVIYSNKYWHYCSLYFIVTIVSFVFSGRLSIHLAVVCWHLFHVTQYLHTSLNSFEWNLALIFIIWVGIALKRFRRSKVSEWLYNSAVKSWSEWLQTANHVQHIIAVKWITRLKANSWPVSRWRYIFWWCCVEAYCFRIRFVNCNWSCVNFGEHLHIVYYCATADAETYWEMCWMPRQESRGESGEEWDLWH